MLLPTPTLTPAPCPALPLPYCLPALLPTCSTLPASPCYGPHHQPLALAFGPTLDLAPAPAPAPTPASAPALSYGVLLLMH